MAMPTPPWHVLFLCTHNAARSIMAEALLNQIGAGRFRAFSAGSCPRPESQPHPLALAVLAQAGVLTAGLSSKSWDEFAHLHAPRMDCIITVCDQAAGEGCPLWPGRPATAHWGYTDPSAGTASIEDQRVAFRQLLAQMRERISRFVDLTQACTDLESMQAVARALARGEA